jgi:hypothetical protein
MGDLKVPIYLFAFALPAAIMIFGAFSTLLTPKDIAWRRHQKRLSRWGMVAPDTPPQGWNPAPIGGAVVLVVLAVGMLIFGAVIVR